MICYLDASAIVKLYVSEFQSKAMKDFVTAAEQVGTAVISRAEVSAALAKSERHGTLARGEAELALREFEKDWPDLVRVQTTEEVVKQAAHFAWKYQLRGYDSVQLSSASAWRNIRNSELVFATFDRSLWNAAQQLGLRTFPETLKAK